MKEGIQIAQYFDVCIHVYPAKAVKDVQSNDIRYKGKFLVIICFLRKAIL